MGGAIYLGAGSLTLADSTIDGDFAQGGAGGQGGQGGNGYSIYLTPYGSSSKNTEPSASIPRAAAPAARRARRAPGYGGGVYVGGGTLTITRDVFTADLADGGMGATGGFGGSVLFSCQAAPATAACGGRVATARAARSTSPAGPSRWRTAI